jgi:hypothetical protein
MPAYGRKIRAFLKAQNRLPLSRAFSLDQPETMNEFDSVIVGSDEVWNLKHPWYGGKELFFGKRIRSRSLVSYAASFGNYPATEVLPPRFAEHLRQFKAISVRDFNSQKIIRDAVGIEPCSIPAFNLSPIPILIADSRISPMRSFTVGGSQGQWDSKYNDGLKDPGFGL